MALSCGKLCTSNVFEIVVGSVRSFDCLSVNPYQLFVFVQSF